MFDLHNFIRYIFVTIDNSFLMAVASREHSFDEKDFFFYELKDQENRRDGQDQSLNTDGDTDSIMV